MSGPNMSKIYHAVSEIGPLDYIEQQSSEWGPGVIDHVMVVSRLTSNWCANSVELWLSRHPVASCSCCCHVRGCFVLNMTTWLNFKGQQKTTGQLEEIHRSSDRCKGNFLFSKMNCMDCHDKCKLQFSSGQEQREFTKLTWKGCMLDAIQSNDRCK